MSPSPLQSIQWLDKKKKIVHLEQMSPSPLQSIQLLDKKRK